jgi:hypothetical protein
MKKWLIYSLLFVLVCLSVASCKSVQNCPAYANTSANTR